MLFYEFWFTIRYIIFLALNMSCSSKTSPSEESELMYVDATNGVFQGSCRLNC